MASIVLNNINKRYADGTFAVRDLSMTIEDGEFMVVVGPSGCGKSTALRMVAGLEDISGGTLSIGGKTVNHLGARDRDIAMVFQNYALYPHMTIAQNIAFPLESRGVPKAEIDVRVREAAAKLGLTEHLSRRPKNLSGGQRQRVAMGRAIVRQPQAFLMDEPLSNLDAKLRNHMRAEIIDVQRSLGVTTLYVTHDQVEAMTMGHRIAVLRKGVLQQIGAPMELYHNPVNLFVAAFLGSPSMNLFEAVLRVDGGQLFAELPDTRVAVHQVAGQAGLDGKRVVIGIRPEHIALTSVGSAGSILGQTTLVEDLPPERLVHALVNAKAPATSATQEVNADIDASVTDTPQATRIIARLPLGTPAGETVGLLPDPSKVHVFDAQSGLVLA